MLDVIGTLSMLSPDHRVRGKISIWDPPFLSGGQSATSAAHNLDFALKILFMSALPSKAARKRTLEIGAMGQQTTWDRH
jgi:hypothetical protein